MYNWSSTEMLAEMYEKLEQKAITILDICLDEDLREISNKNYTTQGKAEKSENSSFMVSLHGHDCYSVTVYTR